jgi:sulfur carrier protein ThiS adenylyltransferase
MPSSGLDDIYKRLSNKTVGIAGAGGLGSNCAVALARAGVGKLIIADFDTVSPENLNRQYFFADQTGMKKIAALRENIKRANPDTQVVAYDLMLDSSNIPVIFKSCQVIIEAFDLAVMKQMIAETVLSQMDDKYLIMGSGVAGFGCNNLIRTTAINEKFFICGDQENETSPAMPPLAPRVGIVAHMQANQALEILLSLP